MSENFVAPLPSLRAAFSVTRLGAMVALGFVLYFVFVVPDELALVLVGSAAALTFASYAPVFAFLAVMWLVE